MINKDDIKMMREELGLSQSELAKRAGITQGTISRYETGKEPCGYTYLNQLSKGTKCEIHLVIYPDGSSNIQYQPT